VTGTNVQDALCQLEQWAQGLTFDAGVLSVQVGDGLLLSGTSTNPVVALQPVGSAGTYAGLEVNEFGQVVGYTPVSTDHPAHTATAPLAVTFDPVANTWSHTVEQGDETQFGVVRFVSVGDIQGDSVAAEQEEWAISYEGARLLVQRMLADLGAAEFDISSLAVSTSASPTDEVAIYNHTTSQHERVQLADIGELIGATSVLVEYDPATGTTGASEGTNSITSTATGVHDIALSDPLANPVIHVTIRGDQPLATATAELATSTTLRVRTYTLEVVGGALEATPADHPFYLSVHEDV
jgi:hypothetical protein